MAIVSMILLTFVVGMVELGRVIMVHQVLVNAAREGARRAVVPEATDEQVNALVDGYMASAGITGYQKQISPSLAEASSHVPVRVTVSVPHSQISWGFTWIFSGDTTFSESVTMRTE
jgi:Flp pilus assembly protein TadG